MKVVIAIHHFLSRYTSGGEIHGYQIASWLMRQGHDVRVICIERIDHGPDDGVYWEDTEYETIPVRRLSFDLAKAPDRLRWEYDNPWIEKHLRHFLAEIEPDVFHLISGYLMGAGALRAARELGIPIAITLTDFWFLCPRINLLHPNGELSTPDRFDVAACTRCRFEEKRRFRIPARVAPRVANWFWRQMRDPKWGRLLGYSEVADRLGQRDRTLMDMLSAADVLICPSGFTLEGFRARGLDPEKLALNVHGVNTSTWLPVSERDRSGSGLHIGYLGQIEPHKGVHLLVEAFQRLQSPTPLKLMIYGNEKASPRYTNRLRRLARGDERVMILGRYEPEQVAQVLAQIDVLVIPSVWNEIGPLVMYEALHTRTPVVASDIPNMSHIVHDEKNGLLFSCGDSADLAKQLQRLIDHPDLLARLRDGIEPGKGIDEEMSALFSLYASIL